MNFKPSSAKQVKHVYIFFYIEYILGVSILRKCNNITTSKTSFCIVFEGRHFNRELFIYLFIFHDFRLGDVGAWRSRDFILTASLGLF